jgi:hypothetical protein
MILRIGLSVCASLIFVLFGGPARSQDISDALKSFAAAKVVIGQKNFSSSGCNRNADNPSANTICESEGPIAKGKKVLYVTDGANARVLGFKKTPKKNGASANFVLGQTNFSSANTGVGPASFSDPTAVAVEGTQLFVNDFSNNRVLIWNALPTTTDAPADVAVGQPDLNSDSPATTQSGLDHPEAGLAAAGGKLFVGDRNNNRIMIWNTIPTSSGADADVVLGQTNFSNNSPAVSSTGLDEPEGIWSDGTRLVVADFMNNRVLIWNSIPTSNGAPADVVVGQADFTSSADPEPPDAQSLARPADVASDGTRLFVLDEGNNRVLVYNSFPTANNPTANTVLGQRDFMHGDYNAGNSAPSAQTLGDPFGLSVIGKQLFVNDYDNNRVLIFGVK